jgi:hypothetical protein
MSLSLLRPALQDADAVSVVYFSLSPHLKRGVLKLKPLFDFYRSQKLFTS